jgi:hypothetical protein
MFPLLCQFAFSEQKMETAVTFTSHFKIVGSRVTLPAYISEVASRSVENLWIPVLRNVIHRFCLLPVQLYNTKDERHVAWQKKKKRF